MPTINFCFKQSYRFMLSVLSNKCSETTHFKARPFCALCSSIPSLLCSALGHLFLALSSREAFSMMRCLKWSLHSELRRRPVPMVTRCCIITVGASCSRSTGDKGADGADKREVFPHQFRSGKHFTVQTLFF